MKPKGRILLSSGGVSLHFAVIIKCYLRAHFQNVMSDYNRLGTTVSKEIYTSGACVVNLERFPLTPTPPPFLSLIHGRCRLCKSVEQGAAHFVRRLSEIKCLALMRFPPPSSRVISSFPLPLSFFFGGGGILRLERMIFSELLQVFGREWQTGGHTLF